MAEWVREEDSVIAGGFAAGELRPFRGRCCAAATDRPATARPRAGVARMARAGHRLR
ncbi:hypothetical protein [Pilimelia anulata]|uniref:hypothetical protein n=1 Tax=Pilimelia anulata TaxID=53371 RepID=UPI001668790F|nr:hypothetical protein [Pilimelia anulata]